MTTPFADDLMTPKDRAKYGAALAKGAAFDAVRILWRRREAEGWTQTQVADEIAVDTGWLSKQFAGPRNWTMETFGALVVALKGEAEIFAHALEDALFPKPNYDAYREYDALRASTIPTKITGSAKPNPHVDLLTPTANTHVNSFVHFQS